MEKTTIDNEMPYMSPMTNREDAAKLKGFTENFEIVSAFTMTAGGNNRVYAPAGVKIVNYYRFEGMTDPGDSNILYEIETYDGTKGVLITPYGPDCPAHVAAFVTAIPEMEKLHEDVAPLTSGSVKSSR